MAKSVVVLLLYCTQFYFVYSIGPRYEIYKDPDYKYLPPIYRMEDFQECTKRQDSYCEIQIEVSRKGPSPVWHIMEETMTDTRNYLPRNKLRRALCLPKSMVKNKENLSEIILNRIEYEISPINLTGKVNKIDCNEDIVYTLYDLVFVLVCTFYISLLLYCTMTDWKIRNKKPKSGKDTPYNIPSFIAAFSFISNFEKFKKLPTNADYQRLKSFQGMRCVVMILIVVGHSLYSHMYGYLENPDAIETHIALYGFQMFVNMGMLQVQIFLLMSGFLLALQVLTINDLFKGFKLKQAILLNINRYLRLLPVVGTMIAMHTSAIPLLLLRNAPMASKLMERTENCKKNWWKTVLFIHNNEAAHKMCESGTWYIGVDSQMYAVSLIFLYFIMKFKLGFKALAQIAVALTVFYASLLLYYNMDFFCRITPERLQFGQAELLFDFTLLYTSTYSSASTFIIGIMFGWFYYKNKTLTVNTKLLFIPWFLLFFVLPWFILHVTIEDYSGSLKPFYGAIIKPVFAFGVGMGLLGMSYGIGGPIKKIFEWKYFEYFAKITFSMYIFHFDIVFPRSLFMYTPLYLTVGMLIKNHIIDLILSIILGFIMYMIIELPFSNFFKLLLKGVIEKEKQKIKKEE